MIQAAKGAKAYEKAEDPIYALDHNLPIDFQHYLEHHISQPVLRIFEPMMNNAQELLSGIHLLQTTSAHFICCPASWSVSKKHVPLPLPVKSFPHRLFDYRMAVSGFTPYSNC